MRTDNCPFCEIVRGNAGAHMLYESVHTVAFLDINPINAGHALVVTKEHFENFLDVPADIMAEAIKSVGIVSRAINVLLHPEGFNIFNNNGAVAGQSVFHFHFHITPRHDGDGLKIRPRLKPYDSSEQMADLASKIRDNIDDNAKSGEQL